MDYRIIPVTPFRQNCTLLRCPQTRATAIVDPGGEPERIIAALNQMDAEPAMILLTHGHLDHVGAAPPLARRLGLPIIGPHPDDAFWFDALPQQAQLFGFPSQPAFRPDRWLDDAETIDLGHRQLEVLHCPGHTPGHVVLFDADARLAQVGDVLFAGGIGRTDFPRGSHAQLINSIRERLFPLGDDVRFIPGHGPMSTFGEERRTNPFIGTHG
ncbi:MAG: MBL fold metallo-hydrolase [Thiohalocapsa sp.]|jgi:glyoxylase-like metal-dependent hydrolase (beta-lactamase superfamily II)|uniref:MBL fold metallo-hydrolase n=1 Tax=Thiohalocapsa sp. TaxID=2497641 RepID=UPI0025EFAB3F|nr:MBL fold metallo-hydrolase [Thiohalocapsa sp.]MCG6943557.1 MBL fold metallo-hydrolase [Thiohalocapsa sp.]